MKKILLGLCGVYLFALFQPEFALGQALPATPNLKGGQFAPVERNILIRLGNRLQKPGNELMTMVGVLEEFSGTSATSGATTVLWQFPNFVKITSNISGANLAFNGSQILTQASAATQTNKDLVESFVMDTADNFLLERFAGSSIIPMGYSVNVKDPRSTNLLAGQCDLFTVNEVNGVGGPGSKQQKVFCFDPVSNLLKEVVYRENGNLVETRFSGWHTVAGQMTPSLVERWSNSSREFLLEIGQVSFSGALATSTFTTP